MRLSKTIIKLTEISNLLRVHKRYDFAAMIENEIIGALQDEMIARDSKKLREVYLSIFGGSGSITDLYLCASNGDVSENFSESNAKLNSLVKELSKCWEEESAQ